MKHCLLDTALLLHSETHCSLGTYIILSLETIHCGRGRAREVPPLVEELWAANSCWRRGESLLRVKPLVMFL